MAGDHFARSRAAALAAMLTIAAPVAAENRIAPGQDDIIAEMVGRGTVLPGDCRWAGAAVDKSFIRSTYTCATGTVIVELRGKDETVNAAATTEKFAFVVREGAAPPDFVPALAAHVRAREARFQWGGPSATAPGSTPYAQPPQRKLWPYAVFASALAVAFVWVIVSALRRSERASRAIAPTHHVAPAAIALPLLVYAALRFASGAVADALQARPLPNIVSRALFAAVLLFFATLPASIIARARRRGVAIVAMLAVATVSTLFGYRHRLRSERARSHTFEGVFVLPPHVETEDRRGQPPVVTRFRTNEYGFREPSFRLARDPKRLRIALVGDSNVFGVGVEYEDSLAATLSAELTQRFPATAFDVVNLGIPGDNIASHVAVYDVAARRLNADVVVICVSLVNDSSRWDFQVERHEATRPSLYSLARFTLGDSASVLFDHLLLERTVTAEGKLHVEQQAARLRELRAGATPAPPLVVFAYHNVTEELTSTFGAIPGATVIGSGEPRPGDAIAGDGHPTGAGNRRIARILVEHFATIDGFARLMVR